MAVQYSLSYDAQGNPSLVKNTTTGSAPVIKTDNFTVGEYTPKRSIMTDFDFEDAFSPEQQYKILQTYIADNDADPGNDTNRGGPDIFKKKYTLNEQQKINSLMMAGLEPAGLLMMAGLGVDGRGEGSNLPGGVRARIFRPSRKTDGPAVASVLLLAAVVLLHLPTSGNGSSAMMARERP